ncbi:MAG: response regulator, partial [Proteobacteria bacterium]
LNKMAADLKNSENANRLKSLFLANMSHEMRTPLGAILGFAKLLQDPKLSREDRAQYISIIEKTGESLTKIINDILDLSKVEAGHLEIDRSNFSLRALLNEVRMMSETKIGSKPVKILLHIDETLPDQVTTDPQRLQQILMNLLGNAIKFTEAGEVRLIATAVGPELVFTVKDTGVGIAHDKKGLLFKTFSQVDSSLSRRHEGTGLGLVLSRHLARMLGGDVVLSSSETGYGSTFVIRIPFEIPAPALAMVPSPEPAKVMTVQDRIQGKTILLVDDSEINRLLINRVLTKQGLIVEMAVNGLEAVEKVTARPYDAVLMDIQMPVMDGRTATQKLRELGYSLPIIALTAHAMKEDRDRCLEAGCNDYLTKPVDFELLFATLANYMGHRDQARTLDL